MTLDDIQQRCKRCPECHAMWAWGGKTKKPGHKVSMQENYKEIPVRRMVFALSKGRPLKRGHIVRCDCPNDYCMNPELLREISRAKHIKEQMASGQILNAAHKSKIAASIRLIPGRLGDKKALAIYQSDDGVNELASQYGVSVDAVYRIKNMFSYKHLHAGPFATLIR